MRAVLFEGPGQIRLTALPLPDPRQGEVRLKVLRAGICATDSHILQGHFNVCPPRVLGHEVVGFVDSVGAGVPTEWIGQTCGISPARFCGRCPACMQGLPELCANFECLGNTQDGGFAEYTLARAEQLVPIHTGQSETAIWLEPLACVLHAVQAAQLKAGEHVLVVGAGVLGKLLLMTLQAVAGVHVAAIDPNPEKVAEARALGAQAGWVTARTGQALEVENELQDWAPEGVQAVIDTSGSPQAIQNCLDWAGPGGRIVLFGVTDPQACLNFSPAKILGKELTLTAVSGMTPGSFEAAKDLLLSGKIDPAPLVSARIGLEGVPEELRERKLARGGKVLVVPRGEAE